MEPRRVSRRLDGCYIVNDAMRACQCSPGVRQPWTRHIYSTFQLENLEGATAKDAALYSKVLINVASIPEHSLKETEKTCAVQIPN